MPDKRGNISCLYAIRKNKYKYKETLVKKCNIYCGWVIFKHTMNFVTTSSFIC